MRARAFKVWIVVLLSVVCALSFAAPAFARVPAEISLQWGNGGSRGNYRGGHGWIAANAARMAARHGAAWVNVDLAVDRSSWPDEVFGDHIDHNYNRWGTYDSYYNSSWGHRFGNPQKKVQRNYNLIVAALKRGDKKSASKSFGIMSHYFADVNQPMHTQESRLETDRVHSSYEAAVDRLFGSTSGHQGWLHDDGYQYVPSASAFTVAAAVKSHSYYSTLVSTFAHHGMNGKVMAITAGAFNRAVNGLSDLAVSAQYDADTVRAVIDSVSRNSATTGQAVTFVGHGRDPRHKIVAWQWRSSIDGVLSSSPTLSTSNLSVGVHGIYLRVKCAKGKWSPEVGVQFVVGAAGTTPKPVYRFVNRKSGGYLLTASESEKHYVIKHASSSWAFQGVAYAIDASASANSDPVYRFRNIKKGAYFYTARDAEKALMLKNRNYRYDGAVWKASLTATDTQPVYRFYNRKKGVYIWTASLAEKKRFLTTLRKTWRFDGVAFYNTPPW